MIQCSVDSALPASRYEQLRRGALGAPIEPASRRGLTLLLRRGLWSWARSVRDEPAAPLRAPAVMSNHHLRPHSRLARLIAEAAFTNTHTAVPSS